MFHWTHVNVIFIQTNLNWKLHFIGQKAYQTKTEHALNVDLSSDTLRVSHYISAFISKINDSCYE